MKNAVTTVPIPTTPATFTFPALQSRAPAATQSESQMIRQYRKGQPGSFAITLKDSGRMIGTIGFMWINLDYRSGEVGYSLSRAYWNQGIMTEALRAVLAFGFDTLQLNRIEAQHETDNPASGRVMLHAGMQYEGTLRQRLKNKGRYVDVALYAILRADPRP